MIYVNGDSHSAGADIIPGVCFAQDDPRYLAYGRRAHPEAVVQTYGYFISQAMNQGFFCEAESGSSNDRILRTTKKFVNNTKDKNKIFLIIGWTSWEREEWKHGEDYIQITASGTDSVPESMEEEYKEWVAKQTPEESKRKEQLWYDRIWDFHCELNEIKVKHLFFNSMNLFTNNDKDWDACYAADTYTKWAANQGFNSVENSNHYGADAHRAWAKYLIPYYSTHFANFTGKSLTNNAKRNIMNTIKEQHKFKGFNR